MRQALAHAIDGSELEQLLPPLHVLATGGMVPPMLQGHTPGIALRHEPERARALLAAASLTTPLTIEDTTGEPLDGMVRTITAMWRETLGIDLETAPWEEAAIVLRGWMPGYPDPEYYLRLLLHSEAQDNIGHFRHAPYDELIERARAEADGRRRLELFHAADRMAVAEQVAAIPLTYTRSALLVKPWVHGWWEYGKSWANFADLVVGEPDR